MCGDASEEWTPEVEYHLSQTDSEYVSDPEFPRDAKDPAKLKEEMKFSESMREPPTFEKF